MGAGDPWRDRDRREAEQVMIWDESWGRDWAERILVSAEQMQRIEQCLFAAGMPVEALMEKVALQIAARIQVLFPKDRYPRAGILVGAGHNGGDGLVVGRELYWEGRQVQVWLAKPELKPLTQAHARYLQALGAEFVESVQALAGCDLLIDALFGIGLDRPLKDPYGAAVAWANQSGIPIVSVDLPSGMQGETGASLGSCIQAHTTLCLGLWKRGLWQDQALDRIGHLERIEFGIPRFALEQGVGSPRPELPQLLSPPLIQQMLPQQPSLSTHKYRQGSVLLVCGSMAYSGAAVLTALGARPSGVGMVTVAAPRSLKLLLHHWVPEALVQGCEETPQGAIADLSWVEIEAYDAIALGPGLSLEGIAVLESLLDRAQDRPLVLDADGLNGIARLGVERLRSRPAATVLTPHPGEFRRLFPEIDLEDRLQAAQQGAKVAGAVVVLKGARTVIADPEGALWVNPESTPALARGGSGDVLTGVIGGLLAQGRSGLEAACVGVWWHSQAALRLESRRGSTGVDPVHLAEILSETRP